MGICVFNKIPQLDSSVQESSRIKSLRKEESSQMQLWGGISLLEFPANLHQYL